MQLTRKVLLWLSFGFGVSLMGCQDQGADAPNQIESKRQSLTSAESVASILNAVPGWLNTLGGSNSLSAPFTQVDLDAYQLAAIQLQEYSDTELRDGITLAMANAALLGTFQREAIRANAFVILRIVYDVPVELPHSAVQVKSNYASWKAFGAWKVGSKYPLLWPASFSSNGLLNEVEQLGAVHGPGPHDIIAELDWFKTFGSRDIPSCVARCGSYDPLEACQCDTYCDQYGDCCVDYNYTCGTASSLASGGGGSSLLSIGGPASFAAPQESSRVSSQPNRTARPPRY